MDVTVTDPRRAEVGGTLFADITPANVLGVLPGAVANQLVIVFDADLTPAQIAAVIDRCKTPNANAETLRQRAKAALVANRTYLLTADTATAADVRAQVKALTQQVNGLIRFALTEFDGTE